MATNVKEVFTQNEGVLSRNPRLNLETIRTKIAYLNEFDRHVMAPIWGYPSECAYYRDATCVDPLTAVKTPLFAINAEDDPVS